MTTTIKIHDVVTKEAIRTRIANGTIHNGKRIIASGDANSWSGRRRRPVASRRPHQPLRLVTPYNHALSTAENHSAAATKWLEKHMNGAIVAGPGLMFGGDYYFTWTMQRNS